LWWCSWDNYLRNTNESETLGIAAYMQSTLLPFGYDLVTIDEGWYSPQQGNDASLDAFGRPTPWPDQYPSALPGVGLSIIAERVHAMGLRLGVWTIRGIPAKAVQAKLPIFGTGYTADQAVRADRPCSWNTVCQGCADAPDGAGCNAAAVAYYASLAAWYRAQGIDLVKVDCMWPGRGDLGAFNHDLVAFTDAFRAVGIEVSLSPGSLVSTANASFVSRTRAAVQYRVTDDFWDSWTDVNGPDTYPTGLRSKLDKAAEFAPYFGAGGTYPDLDMLPLGQVYHMAQGPFAPSNLTHDEQRLMLTLWCATGAPLIIGARLPLAAGDDWTLRLLTNAEVLAVHNASSGRTPVAPINVTAPPTTYAWASVPDAAAAGSAYLSLYNAQDAAADVGVRLAAVPGLRLGSTVCARDLWAGTALPGSFTGNIVQRLPPHAAAMLLLQPC